MNNKKSRDIKILHFLRELLETYSLSSKDYCIIINSLCDALENFDDNDPEFKIDNFLQDIITIIDDIKSGEHFSD